jgi:amino acid transporter
MAYVFANYANEFYSLGPNANLVYGTGAILGLTLINALGMQPGKNVQKALTLLGLFGLLAVVLSGLYAMFMPGAPSGLGAVLAENPAPAAVAGQSGALASILTPAAEPSFALAMVLIFYAYGGWNEAAFVAAEVRRPRKNIARVLIVGTLIVTLIYLVVNTIYIGALGYAGVCGSKAVASNMLALTLGETGRQGICLIVMTSSLAAINGLLFTGVRLYGTFGRDHRVFAWLAPPEDKAKVAWGALLAQAGFSLFLITMIEGASIWRQGLSWAAALVGWQLSDQFHASGGIYDLVTCTAPVFWVFFLLTGCSLFVLRWRRPEMERPFKVPLYPVVPLLFVGSCLFMLYRSTAYAIEQGPAEALVVAGLMLAGLPCYWLSGRMRAADQANV